MTNQLQDETWQQQRLGYITASRLDDVLRNSSQYKSQLIAERSGVLSKPINNYAMKRGQELERVAIKAYGQIKDVEVTPVGFIKSKKIPNFGASPDGLINEDGGLEIKCLYDQREIYKFIDKNQQTPIRFVLQCVGGMLATDRSWWDLMLFCPQLEPDKAVHIARYARKDFNEKHLIKAITEFDREVENGK